jgi:hypothetical protein
MRSRHTRYVKKFATQFEADKLGEEPPEGSNEWKWPQMKEYLEKKLENRQQIFK